MGIWDIYGHNCSIHGVYGPQMEVSLSHGGTPSCHPFIDGIFPFTKPIPFLGPPWKAPYNYSGPWALESLETNL